MPYQCADLNTMRILVTKLCVYTANAVHASSHRRFRETAIHPNSNSRDILREKKDPVAKSKQMSEHVDTGQEQDCAHKVHSRQNRGCRGCAAAFTVIRDVIHLGCYFEYGAVEVAVVVVVDQEEVRGAVPFAWIVSIYAIDN